MNEFVLRHESGIDEAAAWFLKQGADARIFAFSGEMGAGKTTFIKALCRALEVGESVSSPSFALVYEYYSPSAGPVYHFDLYRIRNLSELYDLGYEDYFYSGNYCFIEWPEIAESLLPEGTIRVTIVVHPDKSRKITLSQ